MRQRVAKGTIAATLGALCLGLWLAACGGSEAPADPWAPSNRQYGDYFANRWWWTPVERHCEEDEDCEPGEQCQNMRLGTCSGCPRGETQRMCIGPEENPREARGNLPSDSR